MFIAVAAGATSPTAVMGASLFGLGLSDVSNKFTDANLLKGSLKEGLYPEIFSATLAENLYYGNEFLVNSTDHSPYANAEAVNLPQAGGPPKVNKNKKGGPGAVTSRKDSNLRYVMDEYGTDPQLISRMEELIVNYQLRQSIVQNNTQAMRDSFAVDCLHKWVPTKNTNIIRTTGASGTALASGATGNRKKTTLADLRKIAELFDRMKLPNSDRYVLLDAQMYYELFDEEKIVNINYGVAPAIPNGVIRNVFGLNLITPRSGLPIFSGAGALKTLQDDFSYAEAGTDNLSGLAWHKSMVAHAAGNMEAFINERDAIYQGAIISYAMRGGAAKLREDEKGVIALVQAAA